MSKIDIYQSVTDTIIEAIEKGVSEDFMMPWHQIPALPHNASTGNFYNGVNVVLLWIQQMIGEYKTPIWATYKQWQDIGAQVKKGEKGVMIVFWKAIEIEPDDDNQEPEIRMFAKWSKVFNADQVEGYALPAPQENDLTPHQASEALITATNADIRHEENAAYYHVEDDYINLPSPAMFQGTEHRTAQEGYYSTLFHELTHWSGAKHRLDRLNTEKPGLQGYAFEELIAELGAAMLCAKTGVTPAPRLDHAQYIQNWLKALKNDTRFIFKASSQAQKAADYILSFQIAEQSTAQQDAA